MAARPNVELSRALKRPKTVQAGQTVSRGRVVKYGATDSEILHAAAGENGIGVALEDGAAGDLITIVLFPGPGTVAVKVGTGGATRGSYAVVVADGVTNAAALGGGTVARNIVGKFDQSGVAGDEVGMLLINFTGVSA